MAPEIPIKEVLMPDERDAADLSHEEYAKNLSSAIKFDPLLKSLIANL